jgi:hypothetical protein
LVLSDGRMKLVFITRKTRVSEPTVWKVLHDDLGMKKVFARWIPSLLTPKQKHLIALQASDSFFFAGVYHWDSPIKQGSMQ